MGLELSGKDDRQVADIFVDALFALNRDLKIPSDLKRWNITDTDLETLVEGAAKVTRLLDNNPRPMSKEDILAIYRQLV